MEKRDALRPGPADRIDALLWFAVPVLILFTIPIGFVSNDGLGHSFDFAAGTWHLNPNHLLFEPLGALWQNLWTRHGSAREPVDILKLLSGLGGGLAAGLFRIGVAPRLATSRWAANHATAWLAFSSAFLRLWVSDEIHMIQMPFVVAMAWTAILYLERPSLGRALAIGATTGLAALAFVSNLLIGTALAAALAVWHLSRREPGLAVPSAVAVGLGSVLAAGPIFFVAWPRAQGAPGFLAWVTLYSGGRQPTRIHEAYGLIGSWRGLGESALRALYGTASALVDLIPTAAALRDRQAPSLEVILGVVAFLAASTALLYGLSTALREPSNPANRGALLITSAWLVAILGFGFFWNNSDDQFYFQMAPAFGALAARIPVRRGRAGVFVALSLVGLFWNLVDVSNRRILYPRQERMALLEKEVRGACLVVYPGFDEPEMLLRLSRPAKPVPQVPLTYLASRYPVDEGIKSLTDDIQSCLDAGRRVVLIDIFDTPIDRNPWKFLRRLGYHHLEIERTLGERFSLNGASRQVGPFRVRTVGMARSAFRGTSAFDLGDKIVEGQARESFSSLLRVVAEPRRELVDEADCVREADFSREHSKCLVVDFSQWFNWNCHSPSSTTSSSVAW